MSSPLCRYVSWCVDSPTEPAPDTTALTAAEESSHPNHQSAGSGSIPCLLLSPPETSGGEATFSPQPPQPHFTKRSHRQAFAHPLPPQLSPHPSSALHNTDRATNSRSDEGEDDDEEGRRGNVRPSEAENRNEEKPSLLHPQAERFLLPRSSPVISKRHRPVSWHGRDADTSNPSSSSSPPPGSLSLDQCGCRSVTSLEDLGSKPSPGSSPLQEEKKQGHVSVSSNLNHFLSSLFHLPFSRQQGLAEEHKGRCPASCDAPHTPGLSASSKHSKQRSSGDIFKTSCELDKENAHFIVVDMMLEVLEGVKWTLSLDQGDAPTCELKQKCKANRHRQSCGAGDAKQDRNKSRHSDKTSHRGAHSSCVHTNQHTRDEEEEEEEEDTGRDEAEHQLKSFTVLSTDSGIEDCGAEAAATTKDSLRGAEWLAQHLVLEFRRNWFPSHKLQRGRQSLRSSLQELPGTGRVAVSSGSLAEEIRLRTRMRGSLSWAPPRFQIIFTVQPTLRRSEVVALQHFLCAGCGTEVEPRYIKKLRYCEYLGRYFCDCCHSGSEAVIPGRVLSCWDFGRYPVSDFSKQLLDSVWAQPLFDLTCVGRTICGRVKELDRFRELQEQLLIIKKLLTACRLSGSVMAEFEQLPAHLVSKQPHLFSMDDLSRVKKGQLAAQARAVLQSAISHVESCELCLARGFICEFCRERDVIFPFQSDICRRCPGCKACFHISCFVEKKCPKCARIQTRRKRPDGSTK